MTPKCRLFAHLLTRFGFGCLESYQGMQVSILILTYRLEKTLT